MLPDRERRSHLKFYLKEHIEHKESTDAHIFSSISSFRFFILFVFIVFKITFDVLSRTCSNISIAPCSSLIATTRWSRFERYVRHPFVIATNYSFCCPLFFLLITTSSRRIPNFLILTYYPILLSYR